MARARRSRWLLCALLAGACVSLPLGLLGPELAQPPASPGPLRMRTIVAYSLQRQLHVQQREPLVCQPQVLVPNVSQHTWQSPGSGVHLYSAYYDRRLTHFHFVRVIAMLRGSAKPTFYCQLWYDGQTLILEALPTEIWVQHWDKHAGEGVYRPLLLSCPVPAVVSSTGNIPLSVSITLNPCEHAKVLLKITSPGSSSPRKNFAVCVKGLDFPENDISLRLVEWLELNTLLGAEQFFVYVYSVHPNIRRVLDYYSKRGIVTVIPITLPGRQPNEPHRRSHFLKTHLWQKRRDEIVPYNDCYYRNLETYRFVLPLDVDEVIVPVKSLTWKNMFAKLLAEEPGVLERYSSFSVRNAYFFDSFPTSPNPDVPAFLHTMVHTTRSANFSPAEDSVKSFVSTSNALTVFNHYVLEPLSPATSRNLVLDTRLVQMNHYKAECSPVTVPDCHTKYLRYRKKDPILLKFGKNLAARVTPVLVRLHLIK